MNRKKNLNWVFKLPVLVIYLLFFTVQIFFNLDTSPQSFIVKQSRVHASEYKTVHAQNVIKGVNKTPGKTKVRLNKRFQPSSIPCIISNIAAAPAIYIEPLQIGFYTRAFNSSAILSIHSLRGPPVVA